MTSLWLTKNVFVTTENVYLYSFFVKFLTLTFDNFEKVF